MLASVETLRPFFDLLHYLAVLLLHAFELPASANARGLVLSLAFASDTPGLLDLAVNVALDSLAHLLGFLTGFQLLIFRLLLLRCFLFPVSLLLLLIDFVSFDICGVFKFQF